MPRRSSVLLTIILASASLPARADVFTFDFLNYNGHQTGNLSTSSATFIAEGNSNAAYSLVATGYNLKSHNTSSIVTKGVQSLYVKTGGTGETGLGLNGTPNNEINVNTAIKIDLTSILSKVGDQPVSFTIGSIQKGEGWEIWGQTSKGFVQLASGTDATGGTVQQTQTFSAADVQTYGGQFLVTASYADSGNQQQGNHDNHGNHDNGNSNPDNVVLETVTVMGAPEPNTLAIASLGALGTIVYLRRRARRQG